MANQANNQPARPAPLIRHNTLDDNTLSAGATMWIGAVITCLVIHATLIGCAWLLLPAPAGAIPSETVAMSKDEANVQQEAPPEPVNSDPLNVESVDPAAIEPETETNYDTNRKAEVSVPGAVNPNDPVGILGGDKSAPPMDVPLPPGLGNGTGGGLVSATVVGNMNDMGAAGGYNMRGAPRPGTFDGRSGGTKERALIEGGGNKDSESAVASGLKWIAMQQSIDGAWRLDGKFKNPGSQNDIAGTAFGLLPFLGAGHTHKAKKGNDYDKPIERALRFLIRKQDQKNGNFGGGMYGHCLATIAICEAYGLTQDANLRRPAQMAVNYVVDSQHEKGGWRYGPKQAGDTSVTGWAVMALKSAKMSGLDVPELRFKMAISYINDCCGPNEGYGYTGPGSTPTMSAVGLLCRQYLQSWGPDQIRMLRGVNANLQALKPPTTGQPTNMYYYYYATQVMHHLGGQLWTDWNEKMRDSLVRSQDKSNNRALHGSWDPTGDSHGGVGGRLMYTSLALLTLEVYYRHLPLYYRDAGSKG